MDEQEYLAKEMYALFGLAYYRSEVLFRGLCNILVLCTFDHPQNVIKARIEEKQRLYESMTLGQLVELAKTVLPNDFHLQLDSALIKRNYLAHKFFYEQVPFMMNIEGLGSLCSELEMISNQFNDLDEKIEEWFTPIRKSFGVTDRLLEEEVKKMELAYEDPKNYDGRRPLRKVERIINAWNATFANNNTAVVFESEDGALWQFSDVGLAWSSFEKRETNWNLNQNIQQFLPTNIIPRPKNAKAWDYTIPLGPITEIWVTKEKEALYYKWGIRTRKRSVN